MKKTMLVWLSQYRVATTGTCRGQEHRMVVDIAAESKPQAERMARTVFKNYWTFHKITGVAFKTTFGDILVERKKP